MGASISVAVTGLHRGDNPQPGAAVIRSLRRQFPDIRVVGLSYDPLESGLYSQDIDRVDAAYLLPFPMKGPDMLLERILSIHAKENLQLLIPCLDSEISNFMTIYPKLEQLGIKAMLPTRSAFEKRAKENLARFCQQTDTPGPKTFAANDVTRLAQYAEAIGYPLYVKGKYYEAWLVHTQVDLAQKFEKIARTWGLPVLVQEALIGDEYDVLGLADDASNIVGYCTIRKMLRTSNGKGFGGMVVDDPDLMRVARHVIKALRWTGPFEAEFLKTHGRPHSLFEINPRFPAWVDFPSQIHCNLPARLLETMLGKPETELRACDAGQMFIRHSIDLVGNIAELAKLSSDGEYLAGPLAVTH
jgi:carbamoyl-phosphate synthase large subunit